MGLEPVVFKEQGHFQNIKMVLERTKEQASRSSLESWSMEREHSRDICNSAKSVKFCEAILLLGK